MGILNEKRCKKSGAKEKQFLTPPYPLLHLFTFQTPILYENS